MFDALSSFCVEIFKFHDSWHEILNFSSKSLEDDVVVSGRNKDCGKPGAKFCGRPSTVICLTFSVTETITQIF